MQFGPVRTFNLKQLPTPKSNGLWTGLDPVTVIPGGVSASGHLRASRPFQRRSEGVERRSTAKEIVSAISSSRFDPTHLKDPCASGMYAGSAKVTPANKEVSLERSRRYQREVQARAARRRPTSPVCFRSCACLFVLPQLINISTEGISDGCALVFWEPWKQSRRPET